MSLGLYKRKIVTKNTTRRFDKYLSSSIKLVNNFFNLHNLSLNQKYRKRLIEFGFYFLLKYLNK